MTHADIFKSKAGPSSSLVPLQTMAHVQGASTPHQPPCRRLRPRARQRRHHHIQWIAAVSFWLSLLTIFQLSGTAVNGAPVTNSTHAPVKDNVVPVSAASWRRMGLSETVTHNEQELINKILRDDTPSAAASFHYTLSPSADATVTKTDTDRRLPATAVDDALVATQTTAVAAVDDAPVSSSPHSNGKINQSRSKQEQEAFNKRQSRQINAKTSQVHHQLETRPRRRRRAVNVVVNTFSSGSSSSASSQSVNSNFLLKSIVTEIDDCLKDKCRDKQRSLSTEDIPQLLEMDSQSKSGAAGRGGESDDNRDAHLAVKLLNLSASGLRTLPTRTIAAIVAKLPKIGFIDLSINQLKSANLALSGRLTFLNFSQNQLTRFQLHGQADSSNATTSTLAYLDLSYNNLSGKSNDDETGHRSIVLGGDCANLTMLDLSHNRLAELSFLQQPKHSTEDTMSGRPFRVLNFAHNLLQSIKRDTFADTPHLQILSLAHNLVAEIENDTFAGLQHLQYLDLSDNHLDGSSIRALQGIPDLIGLSLARNPQLGDALQGFVASWSLKELDISATGLCEIPAALAQSVRTLNLAHNHFQMIRSGDLDSYPLLYNLDLGDCSVAEIEEDALGRLEMLATLNLNHNNLRQVPISLPVNLIALHLEQNNIMELQANRFAHLNNLKVLSLSGNKIQYLPALPLRKLLVLNLVSAELHGLSQLVVQTSPHLKDLRLDNNPVKCADLLGIAEWATPCRDVGVGETPSPYTDYHDLDDDELREWAEENDKNNLKYLLDYVASKGGDTNRRHSLQLSTSTDKGHFCRSSLKTTTSEFHLNATQSTPVAFAATLARNKSTTDAERETDTGETEQISSNLPNPRFQQTVTPPTITPTTSLLPLPTIIKTLPPSTRLPSSTDLPPPSRTRSSSNASSAAKNNGKPGEILPMRQNNGSLQITDHLNSNKRNDRDDDATNVNDEAERQATNSANEILAEAASTAAKADTSERSSFVAAAASTMSAHLSVQNEAVGDGRRGKSSESVAIKLAYNKSANIANDNVDNRRGGGGSVSNNNDGGDDNKDKKLVSRDNNKKLIKLTDSSKKRKLMPFIEETALSRNIGDTGIAHFAPESAAAAAAPAPAPALINVTSPALPQKLVTIDNNKDMKTRKMMVVTTTTTGATPSIQPLDTAEAVTDPTLPPSTTRTTARSKSRSSTTPVHISSSSVHYTRPTQSTTPTPTTAMRLTTGSEQMSLITVPQTETEKSLPISSKQIISRQQHGQIAETPDDVHNLLPPDESSPDTAATTTATAQATAVKASVGKVVNESVEMRKNLPKTVPAKPPPRPVILRNDSDDNDNDDATADDKQVANDKIMRETEPEPVAAVAGSLPSTKGLIEGISSDAVDEADDPVVDADDDDDDDNPLLKLWQQSSTHLSHTTTAGTIAVLPSPAASEVKKNNPHATMSAAAAPTTSGSVDVNERKNLIRTKSGNNKKVTITRSSSSYSKEAEAVTGASLKSETILINDRNNDDKDKGDDNSAGGGGSENLGREVAKQTPNGEDSDRVDDVLKLTPSSPQHQETENEKENGKIYVAENSLSVAELVLPPTPSTSASSLSSSTRDDPSNSRMPDKHRNTNNNNNPHGDTNRRFDKLSQLNTNSIHVEEDVAEGTLNDGVSGGGSGATEVDDDLGSIRPWNEHIKDDGRRNKGGPAGDDNDDGLVGHDNENGGDDANSDNYRHRQPHPGLFIVIGATMGIVLSIGLFRCKRSLRYRHYPLPDSGLMCGEHGIRRGGGGGGSSGSDINQTYTHHHRHMNCHNNGQEAAADYQQRGGWSDEGNGMTSEVRSVATTTMDDSNGGSIGSRDALADNFSARQRFNDDYYRCTNWRMATGSEAADTDKCDANFVDVQLTPKSERKSVKFDLLPMKILSPNDDQPFYPIMTSDCDYAAAATTTYENNSNKGSSSSSRGGNSVCDMGTGSMSERSNKSSPLDLW